MKLKMRLFPVLLVILGLSFLLRVNLADTRLEETLQAWTRPLHAQESQQTQQSQQSPIFPTFPAAPAPAEDESTRTTANEPADTPPLNTENTENTDRAPLAPRTGGGGGAAGAAGVASAGPDQEPARTTGGGAGLEASPALTRLARSLRERETDLEDREQQLLIRESLVKVIEDRLAARQKTLEAESARLNTLRDEKEQMKDAELTRLASIYATMKPQEAAAIFNGLELATILEVIQLMRPRHAAPILANMAPERSREVTEALTALALAPPPAALP